MSHLYEHILQSLGQQHGGKHRIRDHHKPEMIGTELLIQVLCVALHTYGVLVIRFLFHLPLARSLFARFLFLSKSRHDTLCAMFSGPIATSGLGRRTLGTQFDELLTMKMPIS